MIDASNSSANGLTTLAQLNVLLTYVAGIGKTATNYTTIVEPYFLNLRTKTTNSDLLVQLELCKLYSVMYAKNATNAATIIGLLTAATTALSGDTNAQSTQATERAKIVAFANTTNYANNNTDSVYTQIVSTHRLMWF